LEETACPILRSLFQRYNERGYGIYPQVEFLLGPRQSNDKQAVHGLLKRLMAADALKEQLGGKAHPDYVVVEVIGDIPRDKDEAREIQRDQKARRGFKDKLFEQLAGTCFRVSRTGVKRAKSIYESLNPKLIEGVERGEISLADGALMAEGKPSKPKAAHSPSAGSPKGAAQHAIDAMQAIPKNHPERYAAFAKLYKYVTTIWTAMKSGEKQAAELVNADYDECEESEEEDELIDDDGPDETETDLGYDDDDSSYNLPQA
jgi:hypothetical protein